MLHARTGLPSPKEPERSSERPVESKPSLPSVSPVTSVTRDGGGKPVLPERVPQAHMVEQLRAPRAPEAAVDEDVATPEEVADAWADYEHGTQSVEEELRQDQP